MATVLTLLVKIEVLADMVSIGSLFAMLMVCACVLTTRYEQPNGSITPGTNPTTHAYPVDVHLMVVLRAVCDVCGMCVAGVVMMVLGLVTTSAVCFMLFVRDHPYSAAIFGLLAILPIAYFFKTYAGPAFPLHLPTQQPIDFCLVLTRVRAGGAWCVPFRHTASRRSCLRLSSARWCR